MEESTGKKIYKSKTFWVNLFAMVAMIVQSQTGFVIDGESQGAALIIINIILRAVTGTPVDWGKNEKA